MHTTSIFTKMSALTSKAVLVLLTAGALVLSPLALADPAIFAGSIYQINDVATISGSGFQAGQTVTIRITSPTGESVDMTAKANDEGDISVSLALQDEGQYSAALINTNGEATDAIALMTI